MEASERRVEEGQLRRQVRLGSTAVYRVCSCDGDYARVEVVEAPGLRAGQRYKFTQAAVAEMELVHEVDRAAVEAAPTRSHRAGHSL